MLIYKNKNNLIIGTNSIITKEESCEYVNNTSCVWIDDLIIKHPQCSQNQHVLMYLNENNIIYYEIVDNKTEQPTEIQLLAQQITDLELLILGGVI